MMNKCLQNLLATYYDDMIFSLESVLKPRYCVQSAKMVT